MKSKHPARRHHHPQPALKGSLVIDMHTCDAVWGRYINQERKKIRKLTWGPYSRQITRYVNQRIDELFYTLDGVRRFNELYHTNESTTRLVPFGTWAAFHPSHQRQDKWQALKVLEEASEVVEACKQWLDWNKLSDEEQDTICSQATMPLPCKQAIANEIADLLQTLANLCNAYGITHTMLKQADNTCIEKNTARGMYEAGPRTHMHREEQA
ncbi:hypothetical protein [Bifidobacterium cuniculi]|uniref:Uncharacterized protein n=1 Tax=Bifidobacterium cuniculi TaxID=1688 RepID=A0A087B509_9BIFI|nr:hypothetical protein [Bifidobacterium cuniculi]KFI66109.1 hypothetical protein BCUN_0613 [Bifidobacterium cuniculi]